MITDCDFMMRKSSKRGFTLIELLVVIAVIALLIGILLPALGEARRSARNLQSMANLRSLGQLQFTYTQEFKGSLINPFNEKFQSGNMFANPWNLPIPNTPPEQQAWDMTGPGPWSTENYSIYWYSHASSWSSGRATAFADPIQFSPSDREMIIAVKDFITRESAKSNFEISNYIWPGSYIYSPTFWTTPKRFYDPAKPLAVRSDMVKSNVSGALRRNRIDEVTFPSNKVLTFERFDFRKTKRSEVYGNSVRRIAKLPPNWNNPESTSNVVVADGSGTSINMRVLTSAVEDRSASNMSLSNELSPAGLFNPPLSKYLYYDPSDEANKSLERGGSEIDSGGLYRAFFWATRRGIYGRDFDKTGLAK